MLDRTQVIPFKDWLSLHNQDETPTANPDAFEFDWWLTSENAEFEGLFARVSADLDRVLDVRRRHRNRDTNLRALLASLWDAHDREPGKPIKYARKPAAYSDKLEDRPDWASCKILLSLVDGLSDLGYVGSIPGRVEPHAGRGRLSLIWPLSALIELFERFQVSAAAIAHDKSRVPVVLKSAKGSNGRATRLRHSACQGAADEIAKAAETVVDFNEHIAKFPISLDVLPEGLVDSRGVNLSRTDCHRVFNNVDPTDPKLDQGGRFYGGGWQSLESKLRPYLLIDGKPTVELDFGSLHPRMLYHLDGLDCAGDPYEVPGLSRGAAKIITNRLINATNRQIAAACREPLTSVKDRWGLDLPEGWTLLDAVEAIKDLHRPVSRHFGRGEGLRLQRLDSNVCSTVLGYTIFRNIPVLPIHDSFVVPEAEQETMRETMGFAYRGQVAPFDPVIKTKGRPDHESGGNRRAVGCDLPGATKPPEREPLPWATRPDRELLPWATGPDREPASWPAPTIGRSSLSSSDRVSRMRLGSEIQFEELFDSGRHQRSETVSH